MIQAWTNREIHDTVAAIVADPAISNASQRSILGRLFRYLATRLTDLLHWASGSVDARIITGAAFAIVALLIAARVYTARRETSTGQRSGQRGIARDRTNLWQSARDLAAQGRFTDASHALYAAVIAQLARVGLVKYHASKTNRDYARELRRARGAPAPSFRDFSRAFERAAFGRDDVTADEWSVLLSLAERVAAEAAARSAA